MTFCIEKRGIVKISSSNLWRYWEGSHGRFCAVDKKLKQLTVLSVCVSLSPKRWHGHFYFNPHVFGLGRGCLIIDHPLPQFMSLVIEMLAFQWFTAVFSVLKIALHVVIVSGQDRQINETIDPLPLLSTLLPCPVFDRIDTHTSSAYNSTSQHIHANKQC